MRTTRQRLGVVVVGIGLSGVLPGCVEGPGSEPFQGRDGPNDKPGRDSHPPEREPSRSSDAGTIKPPVRLQELITSDRPPPPLSGGTLAVAHDGSYAVAADPDRDLVYVVRPETGDSVTLELDTGSEPGRVVIDTHGRAHVALRGTGSLVTIDLAAATIQATTSVCTLPRGLAHDAARDAVVVACASGELVTLAAATHEKLASVELGVDLRDVVIAADGSLAVSRYRSAELLRVSVDGQVLGASAPQVLQQGRLAFPEPSVSDGGLFGTTVPLTSVVHLSPALAWKTVSVPGGDVLMLHQDSQDDEVVISQGGGYGGGCETITMASLTRYGADGRPGASVPLAPHGLTVDVAISPDGYWIAVAEPGAYLQGQPTLEVLRVSDLESASAMRPSNGDAGVFTHGDAGLPLFDGGFFPGPGCVSGSPSSDDLQVTSVAYDDRGVLYAFSREPAALRTYEPENDPYGWALTVRKADITLSQKSVRDTGHELFHADVGSGLSCAGCHGEALDDGHVWNFKDFGPRRTQTMRGGLLSTLPLHWEGDMPTFKHLVDEVMTRRMGGFPVQAKYGDALAHWLDKLPPVKLAAAEAKQGAIARGKALFESAEVACASCHSGPQLTNNTTVDVGTGENLQVPTLMGIAFHPPFMHDGCARTLKERFDPSCGGGDKHGKTSHLSEGQIDDLVSYLETL